MCRPQSNKRRLLREKPEQDGGASSPPPPPTLGAETAARRVLSHGAVLKEVLAFAASDGSGGLDAARGVTRAWRAAVDR